MPWVGLQCVIFAFPGPAHLLVNVWFLVLHVKCFVSFIVYKSRSMSRTVENR